jgi:general stress protein 26
MKKILLVLPVLAIIFLNGPIPAADKDEDAAKKVALNLLQTQELVYFSTVNEQGYPETRVVENVRCQGFNEAKSPFDTGSLDTAIVTSMWRDKVTQVKKNNKASVFIVDLASFKEVILIGTVEIVEDAGFKKACYSKQLDKFYPKGADDPNYGVLKFKTEKFKVHEAAKNGKRFEIK